MASEAGNDSPRDVTTTTEDPSETRTGGIRCPHCWCRHHRVTQTRVSEHKTKEFILRWRKCERCGCTWKTREVNEPEIPVIKTKKDVAAAQKAIQDAARNLINKDIPDLPNPFL